MRKCYLFFGVVHFLFRAFLKISSKFFNSVGHIVIESVRSFNSVYITMLVSRTFKTSLFYYYKEACNKNRCSSRKID